MTVKELIAKLKKMPIDAPVLVHAYSGYESVGPECTDLGDIELETVVMAHGRYERFYPEQWYDAKVKPNIKLVVTFPGN